MKKTDHYNNFNLLRFIFALLVIVGHVPELYDGNRDREILSSIFGSITFGQMAVDSFFVLSGFLIVKSWTERPDMVSYISSRILRIYPGFIVSALVCAFLIAPHYGQSDFFQQFEYKRFFVNLLRLELDGVPPVFSGMPYTFLNGPIWTISFEFLWYLVVLVFGILGVFERRFVWFLICIGVSVCYVAKLSGLIALPIGVYSFIRFGMAFTVGGCFYLYRDLIVWKEKIAWISLIPFLGIMFTKFAELGLSIFWGYAILYYAHYGKKFLGFNKYPDISYGVYLYAWPITQIILYQFPSINLYVGMFITFALSIIAGTISSYVVEQPFMRLKMLFREKLTIPVTT